MEDLLIGLLVVGIIMFVVQIVLIVKIISASDNIDRIYHLLYDALQKRTDNTMHKEVSPAPQQTYVRHLRRMKRKKILPLGKETLFGWYGLL